MYYCNLFLEPDLITSFYLYRDKDPQDSAVLIYLSNVD